MNVFVEPNADKFTCMLRRENKGHEMNISIITVCYNALGDLRRTVESVLALDYCDCEYIVVDGDSKDGTPTFLMECESRFKSKGMAFRWLSERDRGTYDAMNKGARMAQGRWVNYMNAGDTFHTPDCLDRFFAESIDDGVGVCYGDTMEMYDFGCGISRASDYERSNPTMPFIHQSCFVRADLQRQFGFDTTYRIIADHDLFHRLRQAGVNYLYRSVTIANYNGQYGLSATHPLTLRKEGLRVHGTTERWYYPFALVWVYLRYGWVQPFKNHAPRWMTDAWMKHKRKYLNGE